MAAPGSDIDVALEELEARLERLRALYEQYFIGIEKIEPAVPRQDLDRRIYALRKAQIRNTAKRFKLQTIIQRYNAFQQYWLRVCREIENGTYHRHVARAQNRFGDVPLTIAGRRKARARAREEEAEAEQRAAEQKTRATRDAEADLDALLEEDIDAALERALDAAMSFGEDLPGRSAVAPAAAARAPIALSGDGAPSARVRDGAAAAPDASVVQVATAAAPPTPHQPDRVPSAGRVSSPAGPAEPAPAAPDQPSRTPPRPPPPPRRQRDPQTGTAPPVRVTPQASHAPPAPPAAIAAATATHAATGPNSAAPSAAKPDGRPADFRASASAGPTRAAAAPGSSVDRSVAPVARATAAVASSSRAGQPRDDSWAALRGPAAAVPASAQASSAAGAARARPEPAAGKGVGQRPASSRAASTPSNPAAPAATTQVGQRPEGASAAGAGMAQRGSAKRAPAHRGPHPRADGASAPRERPGPGATLNDERLSQLHGALIAERRRLNQPGKVSREALASSLRATEAKLRQQYAGRNIDFHVVIKDGKAMVKPIVG